MTHFNAIFLLLKYTILNLSETAISIGQEIIELGILKEKSRDDANHIGIAVANWMDFVISWNFKHMINIKKCKIIHNIYRKNVKKIDFFNIF